MGGEIVRLRLLLLAHRRVSVPLLVALCVAAAAVGVLLARAMAGDDEPARPAPRPAPTAAATVSLAVGDLRVEVPEGFTRTRERPRIPGMDRPGALVLQGYGQVAVAQVPPEAPSLLPAAAAERLEGGLPQPAEVRAGAVRALHYPELSGLVPDQLVDLYVVPTTHGNATVACLGHAAAAAECEQILDGLALGPARPLPLRDAAFLQALPGVVERLNAERGPARATLARAQTRAGRAKAARAVGAAYAAAADTLAPTARPDAESAATVAALRALAGAYDRLGAASEARDPSAYQAAARDVRRGEREVGRRLAALDGALRAT